MTTETILSDDELRHHQGQNLNTIGAIDVQIASCIKAGRAIEQAVLQSPEIQALRKDAERYRRPRGMTWHSSPLCVVSTPKKSVRPGFDCPSGDRMDAAIDAAMEQKS